MIENMTFLNLFCDIGVASNSSGRAGSVGSSQEDLLMSGRRSAGRSGLQQPSRHHLIHRENSDMSTPPDSPYNSQQNLEASNGDYFPMS